MLTSIFNIMCLLWCVLHTGNYSFCFPRWCISLPSSHTWCCSAFSSEGSCWMEHLKESASCSTPRYRQIKRLVQCREEKEIQIVLWHSFCFCNAVGNLGRCAGVAAGSYAGFLCAGPWLWVHYRLLFLQPQEQQLPPWCLHRLLHKLPHICAGYSGGLCCPWFPS